VSRAPRRSRNVRLIAMGTVILGGCSPSLPEDRYVYFDKSACVEDWGGANCEQSNRSHGAGGTYYYGPRYNARIRLPSGEDIETGSPERAMVNPRTGNTLGYRAAPVARGGFGSFGRAFSGGG
jgi:hypothetical protein